MICHYYRGVAISMFFFDALSPILLIAYIKGRGLHKKTWGGWSWESLRGWSQFLKLGVAGYLMIAFEWWGFEISTLVTGSISQEQLAANTALFQFGNLAFTVSLLSFSLSTSVIIS
jgi:MATE family multidrug resistance protein